MPSMNIAFPRFWYVVEAEEVRDEQGRPFSAWRVRKGLSSHVIETYKEWRDQFDDTL